MTGGNRVKPVWPGTVASKGVSVLTFWVHAEVTLQAAPRPLDSPSSALPDSTHYDVCLVAWLPGPPNDCIVLFKPIVFEKLREKTWSYSREKKPGYPWH